MSFFLYGFCRDSCDLHTDLTFDKTIKMFIRLIITSNVLSMALSYMPKFFSWGKSLTQAILGDNGLYMVYDFDGVKVYENISSADFGTMTAFLTSILFFLFTVVCGFIVVLTVLNRILKIYMIAPFAGWHYLLWRQEDRRHRWDIPIFGLSLDMCFPHY